MGNKATVVAVIGIALVVAYSAAAFTGYETRMTGYENRMRARTRIGSEGTEKEGTQR